MSQSTSAFSMPNISAALSNSRGEADQAVDAAYAVMDIIEDLYEELAKEKEFRVMLKEKLKELRGTKRSRDEDEQPFGFSDWMNGPVCNFHCKICLKGFFDAGSLSRHMNKAHNDVMTKKAKVRGDKVVVHLEPRRPDPVRDAKVAALRL